MDFKKQEELISALYQKDLATKTQGSKPQIKQDTKKQKVEKADNKVKKSKVRSIKKHEK